MSLGRKINDLKSRRGVRYTAILLPVIAASVLIGLTAGVVAGIAAFAALSQVFLPKADLFFPAPGTKPEDPKTRGSGSPQGI